MLAEVTEDFKTKIHTTLVACSSEGITLNEFCTNFRLDWSVSVEEFVQQFGFASVIELLRSIPDKVIIVGKIIKPAKNKKTEANQHLIDSAQKNKKKKKLSSQTARTYAVKYVEKYNKPANFRTLDQSHLLSVCSNTSSTTTKQTLMKVHEKKKISGDNRKSITIKDESYQPNLISLMSLNSSSIIDLSCNLERESEECHSLLHMTDTKPIPPYVHRFIRLLKNAGGSMYYKYLQAEYEREHSTKLTVQELRKVLGVSNTVKNAVVAFQLCALSTIFNYETKVTGDGFVRLLFDVERS